MKFHIRRAMINDAEAICQLLVRGGELHAQAVPQLLRPPELAATLDFVNTFLRDESTHVLLAAANNHVIGFVHFNCTTEPEHPLKVPRTYLVVSTLIVKEEYRRQGVGHALMQEVHEWAEIHGINDVELHVYEFNQPALNFYEKLGYRTTSRRMTRSAR